MKKIGVKIALLGTIFAISPIYSMARLTGLKTVFSSWRKPLSWAPANPNNAFPIKKTFAQNIREKYSSLKSMSDAYQKIEDRLPALSLSPMGVSRMTFTAITGIPIFRINFTAWAAFGRKLFAQIMGDKLSFNQVYQEDLLRLKQSDMDGLFIRLEKLAQLSIAEKKTKQYEYETEVSMGEPSQAKAWIFGSIYRDAIHNAETIDDIALLYESASMWLRSRIESGLYDDVANLEIEFDRIDQQVEKTIDKYDEQSALVVKQYLKGMRQDFKNRFLRWFEGRQEIMVTE